MAQQMRQPVSIVGIGLMPAQTFYLPRIRQDDLQTRGLFQNIEDRLPILSGTLHRDVRAAATYQPLPQLFDFCVGGSEAANLSLRIPIGSPLHHAHHDKLLADVAAGAILYYCWDPVRLLPEARADA